MTSKTIIVKPDSEYIKIRYQANKRYIRKHGLMYTDHEYYKFINQNETIIVKVSEILKLIDPFVMQYKQKLKKLLYTYFIFEYRKLRDIAESIKMHPPASLKIIT